MSRWLAAHGCRLSASYSCSSFHNIFLTIPSSTSASAASIENRRSIRRNFSSAFASPRAAMYPLFRSASSKASPIRSTVSISANSPLFSFLGAAHFDFKGAVFPPLLSVLCVVSAPSALVRFLLPNSYIPSAAACPNFIDQCSTRVAIRINQWQWLKSSFDNPHFSDPNKTATRPVSMRFPINRAPSSNPRKGCFISRFPTAVVPTTSEQSATASASDANSFARASNSPAPTADFVSLQAFSYGRTARNSIAPKLLIARATAPTFSGFRVPTSTTHKFFISPLTAPQSKPSTRPTPHATASRKFAILPARRRRERIRRRCAKDLNFAITTANLFKSGLTNREHGAHPSAEGTLKILLELPFQIVSGLKLPGPHRRPQIRPPRVSRYLIAAIRSLAYLTTPFATNTLFIGLAPAFGNDMLQKFPSGQCSSNAPCSLPSLCIRTDTIRHVAFRLLNSFKSSNLCPTGSSASSRITPPCWLTEIVRVENLNGALLSLTPVTSICMLTTARAVLRRSILRQCMIAIRNSSGRRSDSRPQLPAVTQDPESTPRHEPLSVSLNLTASPLQRE